MRLWGEVADTNIEVDVVHLPQMHMDSIYVGCEECGETETIVEARAAWVPRWRFDWDDDTL